ncbi:MAG: response regulator [Anaerolineae bacterium]
MPSILVVDDDPTALKILGLALQNAGYRVILASHGQEALQKAGRQKPDLIILDVMMPEMDGYEVCRRLRQNPTTQRTPVIMLTAKSLVEDKVEGFEAGADDYVTKPVVPAELLARVRAQLLRSQASTRPRGHFIGLLGAKGGTGVTALAVNLSLALQERKYPTILVDLASGNPATMLQLGLEPRLAPVSPFAGGREAIDSEVLARHLVEHDSGLRVLPPLPERRGLAVDQMESLLKGVQRLAAYVVIDFGADLDGAAEAGLQHCHRVALVTDLDRSALPPARQLGLRLKSLCLRDDWLGVVAVNRTPTANPFGHLRLEEYLDLEVWHVISPALDVGGSGAPALIAEPEGVFAGQIRQLAARLS